MKYPFIKCLNPQRIRNPHTTEYLTVPCGKCEACRHSKGLHNTLRCKLETLNHRYCMFVTLTYDEQSIPRVQLIEDDDIPNYYYAVLKNERICDGEILFDIELNSDSKSILSHKFQNDDFPVLYRRDAQLFVKRFRKHLNNFSHEKIRYYIVGEYGPVHFRPHYHALFWFDREETFTHFGEVLNRSWKFGRVDFSLSSGNAINYVAKYVNSSVALPRIFTFNETQPFALHSYYLGEAVLASETKKLEETDFASFTRRSYHFNGTNTEFTLWRSFESRFFPKCHRFGSLDESQCVEAYRTYASARDWTNQTSIIEQTKMILEDLEFLSYGSIIDIPILKYFSITYVQPDSFTSTDSRKKLFRQVYLSLSRSKHFLYKVCHNDSLSETKRCISLIKNYYIWKDYQCLKNQLSIQSEIVNSSDIGNFNIGLLYDEISLKSLDLQCDFAPYVMTNVKDIYSESNLVRQFRAESYRIAHDSIKHKKLNDLNNFFNLL